MKRVVLFSVIALSALMVGCASTECRDDSDCSETKAACCETECAHANSTFECPNCQPGQPCCADCAKKAAEMCPDCAAKKAACAAKNADCASKNAACDSKNAAKACADCKDGVKCAKCAA